MKGKVIAILLALALILFLTVPVFAEADLSHTVEYIFNGTIDLEKTAGHFCNTGAEMKQEIYGAGSMTKTSDIYMKEGFLVVDDTNDFVASATSSLTVTTAIKLCAPAKHVVDGNQEELAGTDDILTINLPFPLSLFLPSISVSLGESEQWVFEDGEVISPYHPAVLAELVDTKPLTKQIWAAQVSADPGFSGSLHTDFTAAYGPYSDHYVWSETEEIPWSTPWSGVNNWLNNNFPMSWTDLILAYSDSNGPDNSWWYDEDGKIVSGPDYVGNYFTIDQFARTSQGTTKRYIDISSPFSHAFLHEDMTVVGRAEVRESFEMMNIEEGSEATTDWWNLF